MARSGYLRDVVYNIGQDRKLGVYKPDLSEWLLQIYPIVAHIPVSAKAEVVADTVPPPVSV